MIDRAEFGRTGHASSRVIFGAAALGRMSQQSADELLPVLLEFGVNHIDTAAAYGDSELRLAPWLATRRDQFFVATKTGDRSGVEARASLERSLRRLGVDHVDLIQLHNLVEDDEWEVAHGPGGAVEAMVRGTRRGPRPSHRRHRPWPAHPRQAPAQPRAFRLRLGPASLQLSPPGPAGLPGRRRGPAPALRRAQRRRADHQSGRPPAVGGRRRPPIELVRTTPRRRRGAARRPLRAEPPAAVPQLVE